MNKKYLRTLIIPASVIALSGCNKPLWLAEVFSEQHENVYISDIALDDDNNTYSTGSVQTYFATDANNAAIKGYDILTVKHDAEGNEVWRATYSSPYERTAPRQFITNDDGLVDILDPEHWDYTGGEEGQFLLNDEQGNTYVVGRIHGENFDANQHISEQDWDVVVLKYNTQGELTAELILEESDQFDATQKAIFQNNQLSLAINDKQDSSYLVLNPDLSVAQSHTLTNVQVLDFVKTDEGKWVTVYSNGKWQYASSNTWVAQYDNNMVQEWHHYGYYNRILPSIVLDSQNNILIASSIEGVLQVDLYSHSLLEKLTPDGELAWKISFINGETILPNLYSNFFSLKSKLAIAPDDSIYLASEKLSVFPPLLVLGSFSTSASTYINKVSPEGGKLWQHDLHGKRFFASNFLSSNTTDQRLNDIKLLPDGRLAVGYEKVFGIHTHGEYAFDDLQLLGAIYTRDPNQNGYSETYNYIETGRESRVLILQPDGGVFKTLPPTKGEHQRAFAINSHNNIAVAGDNYDFHEALPITWTRKSGGYFFQGLYSLTRFEATQLRQDAPSRGSIALFSTD
ncbi:MAG: hypothetical protein CSA49_03000 [Gammaproteobacteria bacterium]|nr:MAG: hypothetical protein CSA49_03000 [Gammaproteobacteria bacterium]